MAFWKWAMAPGVLALAASAKPDKVAASAFLGENSRCPKGRSPYRSRHAIFVRANAQENTPEPDSIPASISSRLLSVRAFDKADEIGRLAQRCRIDQIATLGQPLAAWARSLLKAAGLARSAGAGRSWLVNWPSYRRGNASRPIGDGWKV